MNRISWVLAVSVGSMLSIAGALQAGGEGMAYRATLSGYEEVPPRSTTGTGEFWADMGGEGTTLAYRLSYSDLEGTVRQAHIHFGQKGVNGGIIAYLCGGGDKPACPESGEVSGNIDANDIIGPEAQGIEAGELMEALAAMRAGITYVNVHTDLFPDGEIRGQVKKSYQ